MTHVLLDTDVFSLGFKNDSRAKAYQAHLAGKKPCLSFQSIAELRLWVLLRKWGPARTNELNVAIAQCLVLPFDDEMANLWASTTAHRQAIGRPIATGDAWIAATALRHKLPLLTHNGSDFQHIEGLNVISQMHA